MFQRAAAAVLALGLAFSASACATILHGPMQQVTFKSAPARAKVYVDGDYIGKTPTVTSLARIKEHHARFELEGYEPVEVKVTNRMSHMIWASAVFGVGIGLAVDLITGSIFVIDPDDIDKPLKHKPVRINLQETR